MTFCDFSLSKYESVFDLVKTIDNEKLKICLDTGHVAVFSELSVGDEIHKSGGSIKAFHIHDNSVTWNE